MSIETIAQKSVFTTNFEEIRNHFISLVLKYGYISHRPLLTIIRKSIDPPKIASMDFPKLLSVAPESSWKIGKLLLSTPSLRSV